MKLTSRFSATLVIFVMFMSNIVYAIGGNFSTATAANEGYCVINNVEQWRSEIQKANNNLVEKLNVKIINFDKAKYDIKTLGLLNIGIDSTGKLVGNTAELTYTFSYDTNLKMQMASLNPSLTTQLTQLEKSSLDKLSATAVSLTTGLASSYEKEKAIHDYLVKNYSYDTRVSSQIPRSSHEVTSFVATNIGVCEAYANAFYIMCNKVGIECKLITGTLNGVNHMWNIVKLDGEYYHVDVTSDDPLNNPKDKVYYDYLNVNDTQISKTHNWDKTKFTACTGSKYNYFVYNKLVVKSKVELQNLLQSNFAKGVREVTVCTNGYILYSLDDIQDVAVKAGFKSVKFIGTLGQEGILVFQFS